MKLKISPFAIEDFEESIDYYNEQKEGLGDEFAKNVSNTFERIKKNPEQFPKEHKEMRKAKTEKFPFNVFFVAEKAVAYILGIFHASRNPEKMKERYKQI